RSGWMSRWRVSRPIASAAARSFRKCSTSLASVVWKKCCDLTWRRARDQRTDQESGRVGAAAAHERRESPEPSLQRCLAVLCLGTLAVSTFPIALPRPLDPEGCAALRRLEDAGHSTHARH